MPDGSDSEMLETGPKEVVEFPLLVEEVETGETVEISVADGRIEAFLSDNVFVLDPKSYHGRVAMRSYAYSIAADGDVQMAKDILRRVGKEG